jgi:elongation factor Ts
MAVEEGESPTISQAREALVAKLGENILLRRLERLEASTGTLYSYRHGSRIAVLVELEGGDAALGKDVAMHIAASSPMCVSSEQVAEQALQKEREIFRAQALESGKPDNIVDKIVEGRVRKYLQEITLLGQPFVKDPDMTVAQLLGQTGARVLRFARIEVGEGVERKEENFADEVMAQVRSK